MTVENLTGRVLVDTDVLIDATLAEQENGVSAVNSNLRSGRYAECCGILHSLLHLPEGGRVPGLAGEVVRLLGILAVVMQVPSRARSSIHRVDEKLGGVGCSDSAFQKSRTFRGCFP